MMRTWPSSPTPVPWQLASIQWKINFLAHIQSNGYRVANTILGLIEHNRNGQEIDERFFRRVVNSLVPFGIDVDDHDLRKARLDVYREHFETPFPEAIEGYCKLKSEAFPSNNGVSDYL